MQENNRYREEEKELEEKFGASKKTQSEPKTPTKTEIVVTIIVYPNVAGRLAPR